MLNESKCRTNPRRWKKEIRRFWGRRRAKRSGVGRVLRSSRLDPERGHADPITPADILNVCTCGLWCCLQPLSCLAGPHQPRGSGSLLLLLLVLHHYRPHAFPETSWAQPLGGPRWLSHVPAAAAAAGGGGDILKRVTQAVTGRGHFLCFLSLKRLMRSEAGADSAFVFFERQKKKNFHVYKHSFVVVVVSSKFSVMSQRAFLEPVREQAEYKGLTFLISLEFADRLQTQNLNSAY